jgi:hypothetical protein
MKALANLPRQRGAPQEGGATAGREFTPQLCHQIGMTNTLTVRLSCVVETLFTSLLSVSVN